MELVINIAAIIGILSIAVIYGTDVVAAVVLRSVYADVDDRTLVQSAGRGHYYGDRRLPVVGILGVVLTAATAVLAFVSGAAVAGISATAALVLLVIWLGLFAKIAKPINAALTAAALSDSVPENARVLQARWESIINVRAVLQGLAIALLCVALVVR